MYKIFVFIVICLLVTETFGQVISKDSLRVMLYSNPSLVKEQWKLAYNEEMSDSTRADILSIVSNAFEWTGDLNGSLKYRLMARKLAEDSNDFIRQVRVDIEIAATYGALGMNAKAKEVLNLSLKKSPNIENERTRALYRGFIYHQMANVYEDYRTPGYVRKALTEYNKLPPEDAKIYSVNLYSILGNYYNAIDFKRDSAIYYLNKVLKDSTLTTKSLISLIYVGLGEVEFKAGNMKISEEYLLKSDSLASYHNDIKNKYLSGRILASIYSLNDDNNSYKKRVILNDSLKSLLDSAQLNAVNTAVSQIEKERVQDNVRSNLQKSMLVGVCILIIVLFVLYYFYHRRLLKKQNEAYNQLVFKLEPINKEIEWVEKKDEAEKKQSMSPEVEEDLLKKIRRFENSNRFTNPNLSLASMAASLNTNTQYLSEVINLHKGKNFNAYINELKINYIVNKMMKNKEYRNYKIAYLAEESGFLSHSTFTKVFKQVTGLSPSRFMEIHEVESSLKS